MHKNFSKTDVPQHVLAVCKTLEAAGHEAWVVGGCVRDTLLGRTPKDWDVATSARPEEVTPLFKRVEPTGIEHGTVSIIGHEGHFFDPFGKALLPVEVTTFRGDGDYTDGRRPDKVVFLDSIKGDLARRDFTINAMAFRPMTGAFADPFFGKLDLRVKRIKAVGDAKARFEEDGLRVMRACRFAAQLGFTIEQHTLAAISMPTSIEKFRMVAVERITTEFEKLMMAPHATAGLEAMRESGLFAELFPTLWTGLFCVEALPRVLPVRLAALFKEAPGLMDRLRFPTAVVQEVGSIVFGVSTLNVAACDTTAPALRRWAHKVGPERVQHILTVGLATAPTEAVKAHFAAFEEKVTAVLAEKPVLEVKGLKLNGQQVAEVLGTKPGPLVGRALRWLLDQCFINPALNQPHLLTKALLEEFPR